MSVFTYLAWLEGSLGTIWGPCTGDGTEDPCQCPQCRHAEALEASGRDYDEEYELARSRNFDRSTEIVGRK